MLNLDDKRWLDLNAAYGPAKNIPDLIASLENFPDSKNYEDEPYFSLWSSLCHQGDIYTASYASFPHLIELCKTSPDKAKLSAIQLAVSIDMARLSNPKSPALPLDLSDDYFKAKQELLGVVVVMMQRNPSEELAVIVMQATALNVDNAKWAAAIAEFNPEIASDFLEKFWDGEFNA